MPPILCCPCLLKLHTHLPFHFVQEWDTKRQFWRHLPLTDLGLAINLGYEGKACPFATTAPRPMCLISDYGVHNVLVSFYMCQDQATVLSSPEASQLLSARFWPSTWDRPHTAFTIHVLKDFSLLANQAHVNAHNFYQVLRHKTDSVATHEVMVRLSCKHVWHPC